MTWSQALCCQPRSVSISHVTLRRLCYYYKFCFSACKMGTAVVLTPRVGESRGGGDEGQCLWTWVHSPPRGLCLGSPSPLPWDLLGSGPSSSVEGLPQPLASNSTQISSIIGFCAKGHTGKGVALSRQRIYK